MLYEEYVPSDGSRGGARGPVPPLFLDQTEARRIEKNFFWDRAPPPLSQGLDDRNPPYLKVCIHYWYRSIFQSQFSVAFEWWARLLFSYETGRQLYNNSPAFLTIPPQKWLENIIPFHPKGSRLTKEFAALLRIITLRTSRQIVIYQAWDAVFHHQMKHWEESWKIRRAAE